MMVLYNELDTQLTYNAYSLNKCRFNLYKYWIWYELIMGCILIIKSRFNIYLTKIHTNCNHHLFAIKGNISI